MAFVTDDIYRLGGSQRTKLQYHILTQRFPLVHVDEQDKADLGAARAVYTGCTMTWELWAVPLLQYLRSQREARTAAALEVIQTVMRLLYYQDGLYLTVPGDIGGQSSNGPINI